MLDDIFGGIRPMRSILHRKPDQVNAVLAQRLKARLRWVDEPGFSSDLKATASDVATLFARCTDTDGAIREAVADPKRFAASIREQARPVRALVPQATEQLFDDLLTAAADEFVTLAPGSPRFAREALAQLLRDTALLPEIAAGVKELLERTAQAREKIQWPVVPAPAPQRASAYQARPMARNVPDSGTVVLSGPSGCGKTQIAADIFARSNADLRLWLSASSFTSLLGGYAGAAAALGVAAPQDQAEQRARRLLGWLADPPRGRRWLIVLDDLTNPADLDPIDGATDWWPPIANNGLTIVTTQSRAARLTNNSRQQIDVDHYQPAEAENYLAARLVDRGPRDILQQARFLAEDLEFHPLALAQAAAVILDSPTTNAAEYRERLATSTIEMALPASARADNYPLPVAAAWKLAVERASRHNKHAGSLLRLLALLDPAGAPDITDSDILLDFIITSMSDLAMTGIATHALATLHQFSLTTVSRGGPRAIRTHSLTSRITREHTPQDFLNHAAVAVSNALLELWPSVDTDPNLAAALWDNARFLESITDPTVWITQLRGIHPMVSRLGRSLGEAGQLNSAIMHNTQLLKNCVQILGADDPDTLSVRGTLAWWQGQKGDPSGAVTAFDQLIADYTRVRGPDDQDTLAARHNHAALLGEAGDPRGAADELAEVLADQIRLLGADHPHVLFTRRSLAVWRGYSGDPADAAKALRELLADQTSNLGADHPDTLSTRHALARWLGEAGDPTGAIAAVIEVVADRTRVLGAGNPDTLSSRNDLAAWIGEAGDPPGAVSAFEKLLEDERRVLDPDDPAILRTRHNLAHWRGVAGDHERAVRDLTVVLANRTHLLGAENPDTLLTRGELAGWRGYAGDALRALRGYEALLVDQLRILGPENPQLMSTRENISFWRSRVENPDR
jgi:hypothetical protein